MKIYFFIAIIIFPLSLIAIEEVYLSPKEFILQTFNQKIPKSTILTISKSANQEIERITGHSYLGQRIRYWQEGNCRAWILEEIGKTLTITIGVVIEQKKIISLEVLIYRESHGSEVKSRNFLQQFIGIQLIEKKLNKDIYNITGATLSVNALKYVSKVALYLDSKINDKKE